MDGDRLINFMVWMLSFVLAMVFFYNGISKIMAFPDQVNKFNDLGISSSVMTAVGLMECLGALLLTLPRLAIIGGIILGLIMIISSGLHFFHDNGAYSLRAITIVIMLGGICYLRFKYNEESD